MIRSVQTPPHPHTNTHTHSPTWSISRGKQQIHISKPCFWTQTLNVWMSSNQRCSFQLWIIQHRRSPFCSDGVISKRAPKQLRGKNFARKRGARAAYQRFWPRCTGCRVSNVCECFHTDVNRFSAPRHQTIPQWSLHFVLVFCHQNAGMQACSVLIQTHNSAITTVARFWSGHHENQPTLARI